MNNITAIKKNKFNPGDLVVLKSGGLTMTVEGYTDQNSKVKCIFMSPNQAIYLREQFTPETLHTVEAVSYTHLTLPTKA